MKILHFLLNTPSFKPKNHHVHLNKALEHYYININYFCLCIHEILLTFKYKNTRLSILYEEVYC